MAQSSPKPVILEECLGLPETQTAGKYIDGHIIQKPMTEGKHSAIQPEFLATVNSAFNPQQTSELRCTYPSGSHPAAITADLLFLMSPYLPKVKFHGIRTGKLLLQTNSTSP